MLVGQGPLQDAIKAKVEQLGLKNKVLFLGQRNDATRLYQAMDVFVLPSLYEGLPVVGVEAQAAGLLCVFSDDMTKETKVLDSTKFISLAERRKEWSNIIQEQFMTYQRKNTAEELIKNRFSIEKEAKCLEEKYKELDNAIK